MNTKGVNFQPSERGQFSTAVDNTAVDNTEFFRPSYVVYFKTLAVVMVASSDESNCSPQRTRRRDDPSRDTNVTCSLN